MTNEPTLDIREKSRTADGRELALDRRLFMQLLAFGECTYSDELAEALDEAGLPALSSIVQRMRKTQQTSLHMERMGLFFVGKAIWQSAGGAA